MQKQISTLFDWALSLEGNKKNPSQRKWWSTTTIYLIDYPVQERVKRETRLKVGKYFASAGRPIMEHCGSLMRGGTSARMGG